MIADRFGTLIEELGTALKVKLAPDAHNACRIRFKDKLAVHIEPDSLGDEVQMIIEIGKPGDGKYRQSLLREALRANGVPPPRLGIFCYGQKSDALLLYHTLPMEDLNGAYLADVLGQLAEKARLWRDAISRGEVPPYQPGKLATRAESPFGLR
jgi:hypothetical protein